MNPYKLLSKTNKTQYFHSIYEGCNLIFSAKEAFFSLLNFNNIHGTYDYRHVYAKLKTKLTNPFLITLVSRNINKGHSMFTVII